jgi:hypothetical protein
MSGSFLSPARNAAATLLFFLQGALKREHEHAPRNQSGPRRPACLRVGLCGLGGQQQADPPRWPCRPKWDISHDRRTAQHDHETCREAIHGRGEGVVRPGEPGLLTRRLQHIRPEPGPADRQDAPACTSMFGRLVAARTGPWSFGNQMGNYRLFRHRALHAWSGRNPLASPFLQPYIEVNSRSDRSAS